MAVKLKHFSGVAPALTKYKLPLGMAQVASNINPDSRTIKPWRDPITASTGHTAAGTTTIFRFGRDIISNTDYWFQWAADVDVVKGPVVGDKTERTFWTGDGAPKWTNSTLALSGGAPYPASYRTLGVQAPTNPPVMSVTGVAESEDYRIVGYAYTNVTEYGEESAPSPICDGQKVYTGQTASVTTFDALPVGTGSCVARRLYRVETSSTDTNLYFVKESADATIVDDVGFNIGEVIKTIGWDPPPATMFGIVAMANGIVVGFDGYDVLPSAQYAPYAYPPKQRLSCDFPIVGGCAMGNQVAVLTWGNPYMLTGTTPDSLSLTKLDVPEACVSKRSIVNLGGSMPSMGGANMPTGVVYYASPSGLCAVDAGGSVKNMTEGILNQDDWNALNPRSIQGYAYNGKYIGFFDTGSVQGGFVFDPRGGDATMMMFDFYASGGFYDIALDVLSLQVGTDIVAWDSAESFMDATWRSGVIGSQPMVWRFAKVKADAYGGAVVFRLYGDGNLVHEETVLDGETFSLPADDKFGEWEIEIETSTQVHEVILARSDEDLRQAEAL